MSKKKDLQESNHVIRWSVGLAICVLVALLIFAFSIDLSIIYNSQLMKEHYYRIMLVFLSVLIALYLCRIIIIFVAKRLNRKYLNRFNRLPHIDTYQESQAFMYAPEKKYDHGVLLLHGFTVSPQEFRYLQPLLKDNGLVSYCPNIPGFGLSYTSMLDKVKYSEWLRCVLFAFDSLSQICERVSIVGHSMGGVLAAQVAQFRNVNQLILSAPGFFVVKKDRIYRKILLTRFISACVAWVVPYSPKPIRENRLTTSDTLDTTEAAIIFQYLAVPVQSVKELFLLQDIVDFKKIKANNIHLIYGKHDETVDLLKVKEAFSKIQQAYHTCYLENSAHNCLEDFDRDIACQYVIDALKNH